MLIGVGGIIVQLMMSSILGVLNSSVYFFTWAMGFNITLFIVIILLLGPSLGYWLSVVVGRMVANTKKLRNKTPEIYDHARLVSLVLV